MEVGGSRIAQAGYRISRARGAAPCTQKSDLAFLAAANDYKKAEKDWFTPTQCFCCKEEDICPPSNQAGSGVQISEFRVYTDASCTVAAGTEEQDYANTEWKNRFNSMVEGACYPPEA